VPEAPPPPPPPPPPPVSAPQTIPVQALFPEFTAAMAAGPAPSPSPSPSPPRPPARPPPSHQNLFQLATVPADPAEIAAKIVRRLERHGRALAAGR